MNLLFWRSSTNIENIKELMRHRKDYKSMRLPWSFAIVQSEIFEDMNDKNKANNRVHTDGNSATLHCRR